jgi:DNA-binding transcriptional LysR family regulator
VGWGRPGCAVRFGRGRTVAGVADLELRHLRYLVAVAETGSVTRAAGRLSMTQPALSRAIRALERTAGVALFVRGRQSTGLTPAGEVLLAEAYEILERSRQALENARGSERLTLTARSCDVVAVAAIGREFEAGHPGVRVEIRSHHWDSQAGELRSGGVHVSFLRDCFDTSGLAVDMLGRQDRMVMLPAGHPLSGRDDLGLADLRDEPITEVASMSAEEAAHWAGADLDRGPRRRGPRVHNSGDVFAAVLLGRAIAFAHGVVAADSYPGLRFRPVDGLSASRLEIGIRARGATSTAKQFVDFARARWPGWAA